jgi:rhodanese-related sulfurtransferase
MNKNFVVGLALALVAAFCPGYALADDPPTPSSAKGVEVVSVDQAKGLIGKAQFFDMRAAINYGKGHVKGAVALPYDQKSAKSEDFDGSKDKFDTSKLPKDKSAPIVFYSDGPTGWKSYKAAILSARAGYTQVKWMRDGSSGWVAKGLPLE